MSKGNMFLGQARGKVGDLVFYRQDGVQITRTRNRSPHNPRTNAQLYQRAIAATITAAYRAGRMIFDHSFQGRRVGSGSQREFLSQNLRILRAAVISDLETPLVGANSRGRVVGPRTTSPVGFEGMLVSDGTYQQSFFAWNPSADEVPGFYSMPQPINNETQAQYSARVGLIAGDYYTFVGFAYHPEAEQYAYIVPGYPSDPGAYQDVQDFFFLRLAVKQSFVEGSGQVTAQTPLSDIFSIDATYGPVTTSRLLGLALNKDFGLRDWFGDDESDACGYIGVIRSRKDQDVRSKETLHPYFGDPADYYTGLTSQFLLVAWQRDSGQLGDSNLILEGGDF